MNYQEYNSAKLDLHLIHTMDTPPLRLGEEPTVFDHTQAAGRDQVKAYDHN